MRQLLRYKATCSFLPCCDQLASHQVPRARENSIVPVQALTSLGYRELHYVSNVKIGISSFL